MSPTTPTDPNTPNDPSDSGSRTAEPEADVAVLARLLPELPERDLPPGRHLHHRNVLLRRIDAEQHTARPRRRLTRPAVVMPAVAAALTAALVITLTPHNDRAPAAGPDTGRGATVLLGRIAAASMETDTKAVKDSQFVYVQSLVRSNEGVLDGPVKLGPAYKQEAWLSQDPAPVTTIGWTRESGKGATMPDEDVPIEASTPDGSDDTGAVPAGIDRPTYKWLASLPTDPDALLALLRAQIRPADGETEDQAVFFRAGDLLSQTVMPAANAAAFYRAVAKIPGVTEIPDAVDAAGRHGIGVTLDDTGTATRDEWIFDKHTLAFLGSRSYLTKDHKPGKADVLFGSQAILRRAVVDQHGLEPTDANS